MRPTAFPCRRKSTPLEPRGFGPPATTVYGGTDMNIAAQTIERTSVQPFETGPGVHELRSRLAGITPQIKSRAYTTEKSGRVTAENILILREIGYFEIVKPRAF